MNFFATIFQDWKINSRNPKAQILLLFFRLARWIRTGGSVIFFLGLPVLVFYRVVFEWILGIELPWGTSVGPNLRIFHGFGLVINDRVTIGEGVILRHSTTIGIKETAEFREGAVPHIGNFVDIGSNVVIIGDVTIGDHARIGAGSVVVKDVPPYGVVCGNPAKVIRIHQGA